MPGESAFNRPKGIDKRLCKQVRPCNASSSGRKEGRPLLFVFPGRPGCPNRESTRLAASKMHFLATLRTYLSNSSNEDGKIPSFLDILLLHICYCPNE